MGADQGDDHELVPQGAPMGTIVGAIRVPYRGHARLFPDVRASGAERVEIPRRDLAGALHGDLVEAQVFGGASSQPRTGAVLRVLRRSMRRVAGTVRRMGKAYYLDPDDPRVPGPILLVAASGSASIEAIGGDHVLARIVEYPSDSPAAAGMTVEVIQQIELGSLLAEEEALLSVHGVPDRFPDTVDREAASLPAAVRPVDAEGREDLTHLDIVTIDPWDARDHDDAVAITDGEDGTDRVFIAIADVSYYVPEGSALDREAFDRGTSAYFPDRVVPMLPEGLSAGICSLVDGVDRLALVAQLDIDGDGKVARSRFYEAVIRSRASLSYEEAFAAVEGSRGWRKEAAAAVPFAADLRRLAGVAKRMRQRRMARGALNMEIPEAEILWDREAQMVRGVRRRHRTDAHKMVEDFMLAANEAVARFFHRRKLPTLYRVHESPDPVKVAELAEAAKLLGHFLKLKDPMRPKDFAAFLAKVHGTPAEAALGRQVLRTMKQARYDVARLGHFGLASTDYLHFTSPIRRYPDLVVHRRLRKALKISFTYLNPGPGGGSRLGGAIPDAPSLAQAALQSSRTERAIMDAERDVDALYRCAAAAGSLGEEQEGFISSILGFGFFVELDDPFVEGLVPIHSLTGDYFEVAAGNTRLVGSRSGYVFAAGDRVRVRIENVSLARRQIDLALLEHDAAHTAAPGHAESDRGRKQRGGQKKKPERNMRDAARKQGRKGQRSSRKKR